MLWISQELHNSALRQFTIFTIFIGFWIHLVRNILLATNAIAIVAYFVISVICMLSVKVFIFVFVNIAIMIIFMFIDIHYMQRLIEALMNI